MLLEMVNSSVGSSNFDLALFIIDKVSDFIVQFCGVIIGAAISFIALMWNVKRDDKAKKDADKESLKLHLKRVQSELYYNIIKMGFLKVACGFTKTYGASMELLSEISIFYDKEFRSDAYDDLMRSGLLIKPGLLKNNEEVLIKLLTLYNKVDDMFHKYKANSLEKFYPDSRVDEYSFDDVDHIIQKFAIESSEMADEMLNALILVSKAIIELSPNEKNNPDQKQFWNMGLFENTTKQDTPKEKVESETPSIVSKTSTLTPSPIPPLRWYDDRFFKICFGVATLLIIILGVAAVVR
ncbi:hypothetical protein [Methanocella arvoryzae]|uniref:Uncharacterized protein n=1 Tax=Methanocella arvoryzae (strain DSM 22066 / NBRC 105507 / MRE50) TaxID=351160 RepID=Q0W7W7_METAR|nr:hypothetical protein [Methanocella arvoryzae]CAJ35526.1 hypothetical protein RCIX5 [Methanocella arvoryzae MRE50]